MGKLWSSRSALLIVLLVTTFLVLFGIYYFTHLPKEEIKLLSEHYYGGAIPVDRILKINSSDQEAIKQSAEKLKSLLNYTSKIRNGVEEFWENLSTRLANVKKSKSFDDMDALIADFSQREKSILVDVGNATKMVEDRLSYNAKELSEFVQNQLHRLQNPENCNSARKLVCYTTLGSGFAYMSHHLMYCFLVAYWTGRTLVVESKGWIYSYDKGWQGAFLPLSDTCTSAGGAYKWNSNHNNHQVVYLPDINRINPQPPFLPQAIPRELADKLFTFHGKPFAWFAGQLFSYLSRPNEELKRYFAERRKSVNITKPYVGIHVRRTDKNTEEKYHDLDEYMTQVEQWYQSYARTNKVEKKRLFIATDEPSVIKEAKAKYKDYEVYADYSVVQSAQLPTRYSLISLFGIIFDIQMLAESDYVVCAYTSNVGRLLYEYMQTFHVDGSKKCYSLEPREYFFYCQLSNEAKAM